MCGQQKSIQIQILVPLLIFISISRKFNVQHQGVQQRPPTTSTCARTPCATATCTVPTARWPCSRRQRCASSRRTLRLGPPASCTRPARATAPTRPTPRPRSSRRPRWRSALLPSSRWPRCPPCTTTTSWSTVGRHRSSSRSPLSTGTRSR